MEDLVVAERGAVATLVFNRPAKRNAISLEMWQALPSLLADLAADPTLRVLVIRGAGEEAFASGADISEFGRVRVDIETARRYSRTVEAADRALAEFPRPTLAMIHGSCVGGGLEVALTCDLRFAARTARFGITAARLGIIYGLVSTRRLASIVGPSYARDILYSGRLVGVEEAQAMGLVNRVCEPGALERQTYDYARQLAEQAPLSQRGAKLMLQHLLGEGEMTESVLAAFVERAYESEDYREGVQAFLEKRRPRFQGR
ncbi:MAG TPA: enoyl-CoA hydratase [bacterium]|nr:enoyl-CoA hydratase [bacterium]